MLAPAAHAQWRELTGSSCAVVGQSTCYGFYSNGNSTGSPITVAEYQQLEYSYMDYGDTVTQNTVPSDVTPQESSWGSDIEASLPSHADDSIAASVETDEALSTLQAMGQWGGWATLGDVALGASDIAGTFYVGWQIGTALADLLGINAGSGTSGGGGGAGAIAVALRAYPAGTDVSTISDYCYGSCTTIYHTKLTQDSWVVLWNNGNGNPPGPAIHQDTANDVCSYSITNDPGGEWIPTTVSQNGCTTDGGSFYDYIEVIPITVTAAPGQAVSEGTNIQTYNTPPDETTQVAGANSILTNPADDSLNETACAAIGPSGPCPQWTSIPAPQPGELWSQYETDLQNAGFTKITRQVLGATNADLDRPANAVTVVSPAAGTAIDPATTTITVTTNPDAANMPGPTQAEQSLASALGSLNSNVTGDNSIDIARSCLELEQAAGNDGATDCAKLPIFVSGNDVRQATNHDLAALGAMSDPNNNGQTVRPAWVQLNYRPQAETPGPRTWYNGISPCTLPKPSGESCDEYPFYATQQGGGSAAPPPNLKYINTAQNVRQGGRYGNFITSCGLSDGAPFLVIPLPPGIPINTMPLCNKGS
jgi:hypothetical protein